MNRSKMEAAVNYSLYMFDTLAKQSLDAAEWWAGHKDKDEMDIRHESFCMGQTAAMKMAKEILEDALRR